jgi:hypothetical protein
MKDPINEAYAKATSHMQKMAQKRMNRRNLPKCSDCGTQDDVGECPECGEQVCHNCVKRGKCPACGTRMY